MALRYTPVSRNLNMRVKFMGLEIEDVLVLGFISVVAMLGGQFLFSDRYLFFLPMNWCLMLIVLAIGIPGLMIFKNGKPRGYLADLMNWYSQPHAYSACEPDPVITTEYLKYQEDVSNA